MTLEIIRRILNQRGPLPSSLIQHELVLNYNLSRDAARKQIQRAHDSGEINSFIRLGAGGYLYYLPNVHSTKSVITSCEMLLPSYRPRLNRIVKVVTQFKVISLFELCRLTNMRISIDKNMINPKLAKTLKELELLGIKLEDGFLVQSFLESKSISNLVENANKKFEEEAHLLYTMKEQFLNKKWATEISLYRTPTHYSLANKFDAIGYGGFRKKATVLIELYSRRPVLVEDLMGYYERIWSTISRQKFPKPIFCYVVATSFSESALSFALEKKMKVIQLDRNLTPNLVPDIQASKRKVRKWHGRLADAQGRAFEAVVEKVFRKKGFSTETRKIFYLRGNEVTEEQTRHRLTDIDVFAYKEKEELFLIECKSAKKQISKSKLMREVRDLEKIASYLSRKSENSLNISLMIVGNCNSLDVIDVKRRTRIPIAIFSPKEFYQQFKEELKGEPLWLFGIE